MRRCAREGIDWPRTSDDALDGTPFGATPPRWFAWDDGSDPLRCRAEHAERGCSDNVLCARSTFAWQSMPRLLSPAALAHEKTLTLLLFERWQTQGAGA